jgi:hypothetical protein
MSTRRTFITLLGGAAASPLPAGAKQDRRRLVGVVAGFSEPNTDHQNTAPGRHGTFGSFRRLRS